MPEVRKWAGFRIDPSASLILLIEMRCCGQRPVHRKWASRWFERAAASARAIRDECSNGSNPGSV